jgi:hypothetical protein
MHENFVLFSFAAMPLVLLFAIRWFFRRIRQKPGVLITTMFDRIALWAIWPPENSQHQASANRPDEGSIFSSTLAQKTGAGQTQHVLS